MQESLRTLRIDTHIHSCLSPCATLDMTPIQIVREAVKQDLAGIAVTDHNSAENTAAVIAAASGTGLSVIPGMEITTAEEAHVIGLFQDVKSALSMQALVYANLFPGENDPDLFGLQVVANEFDEVEAINTRLLIGGTRLRVNDVVNAIHDLGGLAIAAHIDRQSFSVISQLGFIPEELRFDALEVSGEVSLTKARIRYPGYGKIAFITASDAHGLRDIASAPTKIQVAGPTIKELRMALNGINGRKILE
ncbi:MAG: PHP domain-containing protein [Desulfobacteraceae bacterium]